MLVATGVGAESGWWADRCVLWGKTVGGDGRRGFLRPSPQRV